MGFNSEFKGLNTSGRYKTNYDCTNMRILLENFRLCVCKKIKMKCSFMYFQNSISVSLNILFHEKFYEPVDLCLHILSPVQVSHPICQKVLQLRFFSQKERKQTHAHFSRNQINGKRARTVILLGSNILSGPLHFLICQCHFFG